MGMYRSPIEIIYGQIQKQIEGDIFRAVQSYDINVDKDELIRALQYDRNQYEKGYADGKADAEAELVRCKDCKHFDKLFKGEGVINKIGTCYLRKAEQIETAQSCDDFCSYGERREGE